MTILNSKNRFAILLVVLLFVGGFFLLRKDVTSPSTEYVAPLRPDIAALNDPESVMVILKEEGTGKEYESNKLIVEFQSNVSEAEALEVIAGAHGVMKARFTAVPLFLVQVKDAGDGLGLKKSMAIFEKDVRVKTVELNYLTALPATPTTEAES